MGGCVVGFDLGGTKMIGAVLDPDMRILARVKRSTGAHEGGEAVCRRIISTIQSVLEKNGTAVSDLAGIGIASPGPLDVERGVILNTPNLDFKEFPLRDRVRSKFDVPVWIENDVSSGVYGEYKRGAARGFRNVVGIFPGTGIGGGLILDGRLYRGSSGNAGEIGHMIIQTDGPLCGCGQYGCVEALASRTALSKDAVALAAAGGAPAVFEAVGTDFQNFKSGTFSRAIKKKDENIRRAVERSARFLGIAMANCVNLFDPDAIVLGGGLVEKLGKEYIRAAEESMKEHALGDMVGGVKVLAAELGDDAVLMGVAILVKEIVEEGRLED